MQGFGLVVSGYDSGKGGKRGNDKGGPLGAGGF